jgi:hypothetical protein
MCRTSDSFDALCSVLVQLVRMRRTIALRQKSFGKSIGQRYRLMMMGQLAASIADETNRLASGIVTNAGISLDRLAPRHYR